jgi:hypothetical protein
LNVFITGIISNILVLPGKLIDNYLFFKASEVLQLELKFGLCAVTHSFWLSGKADLQDDKMLIVTISTRTALIIVWDFYFNARQIMLLYFYIPVMDFIL